LTRILETIERVDALYYCRDEIDSVRESVRLLREITTVEFEVMWRLGRSLFFLGQQANRKSHALEFYSNGIAASKCATKKDAERVEGHFWLGVNLALAAEIESPIHGLLHVIRAKRELHRSVAIDPSYHGAGPLRVLARLRHKLPKLLGGGSNKAREGFLRAIKLAPSNSVTRIYFAELLVDIGDYQRARQELDFIIKAEMDPEWRFEFERDKAIAREMMSRLDC
jgi:hypothetical protein